MYSDILLTVYSVEDQIRLLQEIDILLDSMYKLGKSSFEATMKTSVRLPTQEMLTSAITGSKMDPQDFLQNLRTQIANLKQVDIQIAYQPSVDSLHQIHDWIAQTESRGFVLSYTHDPSLIGGAVVSFRGKSFNGSLKEVINQKFKDG